MVTDIVCITAFILVVPLTVVILIICNYVIFNAIKDILSGKD